MPSPFRRHKTSKISDARQVESKLQGTPDTLLSVLLLAAAGVLIVTALTAPATLKAAVLAWAVFP